MANVQLNPAYGNYELAVAEVFGNAVIGATGAVTSISGKGIASVTRTGVGAYAITLTAAFPKYIESVTRCFGPTATGVSPEAQNVRAPGFTFAKTINVQFYSYAGTATDPASGSGLSFRFTLSNSSVK